jgi:MFS family permease
MITANPPKTNILLTGSLYYAFFWSLVAIYDPYINVYFAGLGLTGLQIGVIVTAAPIATLIWSPLVSAFADQRSKHIKLLRWGLTGWVLLVALLALPKTFWVILPLVFIISLFRSPTMPLSDSLVAGMAARHGLSFGRMRMWGSFGFALTAIIGGYLWLKVGYTPMFAAALLLGIPVIYFAGKLEPTPVPSSQIRGPILELLRDPALLTLFAISFLMGTTLLSTYIFGGIYMTQLGGNEFMMGLMFGLSALVEVPVMHLSGNIIAKLSSPRTMWLALAVLTTAVAGFALADSAVLLVVAGMVKGVGFGLFFVTLVRLIDERAPEEWKSTAQAIGGACFAGLSPLLTSALAGYVFDRWGGETLYFGATLLGVTAVLLMGFAIFKNWFRL